MDIKERLQRLEERRGETADQWMTNYQGRTNEDVVLLADTLAEATEADMAEVVDLIGGLEHYAPYELTALQPTINIGFESMSDSVIRVFDRIIAFIKRWIKVLASAEFRLSLYTGLQNANLDTMRTDIRSRAHKAHTAPTFPVYTRIANMSVNYKPITNGQMLLNSLTILSAVTDMYFGKHSEKVLSQVNQVVVAVGTQKKASELAAIIEPASPLNSALVSVFRQQDHHIESPNLLGNHRLVITDDASGSLDAVSRVQGIRTQVVPSQLTVQESPGHIDFQYFDTNMTDAILIKCSNILKILGDSNTSARRHSRKQAMEALLAAVERVNTEVQRTGIRDEKDASSVVAVLETYISWIADPYTSFYSYILRNVKAAMNVCETNMA